MPSYATFSPARAPTSVDRSREVRVIGTEFGDGYEQTQADGLNALRDKLTVKWDNLTIAQANSIDAFFQARYAVPFNWTPPQQSIQKLWRCTTWSVAYVERHASVSATLEEVFA
ncbi:MAG: phage tail protein [Pyramidobacter sp.]|nr:phage tail protein [Pyramidobacter sp.]MBQ8129402.1 phage tail protein [Clostridia bacterium]